MSLITLILIAFYSMDNLDREIAPYVITFALGIFTLPFPRMLMNIIGADLAVTPAGPNSKTPEPEIMIQEHCRPLRVLFVLFNFLCYIFAMFAASVYACGLDTEENGTYRVSQERSEYMLIMWVFSILFGYFILNGARIFMITMLAYCKASQIKKKQDTPKVSKNSSEKLKEKPTITD